ncbi:vanadium-dependent haloperoxidase [Mucilaginibacter sp. UR6-1]|uniref:vanadium-dependent haloperoxidase n=1 Tax=Mucilaginibacter sp. UR6-1 TaxID=1435643 RepID=UPI001E3E9D43|nr:vanadium-dependent haloperoxidase [Mucilaginibacter sp. UR6-1]MCC8409530.1 vanadium-dependent haloperoxidase [Mucilaginibacter sp. UR6-1]
MKISKTFTILLIAATCLYACQQDKKAATIKIIDADVIHQNEDKLTQLIIYDVFTPPVASRIYAYASLASYEAIRYAQPDYLSLTAQLQGFAPMPKPEGGKKYNFTLAATQAFFSVARKVTFSVDSLKGYEDGLHERFKSTMDDSTYARSIAFGDTVAKVIIKRLVKDNYLQTRGKPKFLGSQLPGKWHPTPPDYLDGVEYCWGTMKTFVLDSSDRVSIPPPPPYSEDKNSAYFKQNVEVYQTSKRLTDEQKDIARYWDDNPFVLEHAGHMTFANKKITPGGHWIGITAIACKKNKADAVKTAQAYALTSIGMYDAFICCWNTKYETNYVRPVTVINDKIDAEWTPRLQTPPFPEYPSGHSTITRAAAVMLTHLFGDNFAFQDTSDLRYIGMKRDFKSFVQAADEASISRFYGGIHYKNSVDQGALQGKKVSEYIISKLKLKK